jgi:hypothetical protein
MSATFDRDSTAAFYAKRHKQTDPAIREIYYLPTGAPANEIRFVEVNQAITTTADPEPIDFGVDGVTANAHKLILLDVTPDQWKEIRKGQRPLPEGWSLEGKREMSGSQRRVGLANRVSGVHFASRRPRPRS